MRVEISMRSDELRPLIVAMDTAGFALIDRRRSSLPADVFKLTGYGVDMQQQWEKSVRYNRHLSLRLYEFQQGKLYLIFGDRMREEIEFYVIDPKSGEVRKHDFFYLNNLLIEDFTVIAGNIYILGTLKKLPILLEFDPTTKKISPFPIAINAKNVEVLEVFNSGASQVSVTVSMEINRGRQILAKTFHTKTRQGEEFVVRPSQAYDLLNGKVTVLNTKDKLVIGTYGYHNSKESQGMYVGGYVGNREVIKKYHRFTDMNNFFAFLGEKEKKRIEEKASKKAKKGKYLKLRYRLLVHEAVLHNDQYVTIGEAYYPIYRTERYKKYGSRGYYYDTRVIFDGYRFTHAVVAAIDKRGDLVWDHSFKINNTKTFQLKERVRLLAKQNTLTLIYNSEGDIYQLQIRNGEVLEKEKHVELKTSYTNDQVRNSDPGQAEYWYGNYFLAWGHQKIKNNKGESTTGKRSVFYINKLAY